MPRIPERSRLPVLVGVSLIAVVLVAGAVIVVPRLVQPTSAPTSSPTLPASPSVDPSTPEGAVRAFFDAFARARRSDDASIVLPFTSGESSDAYRSAQAFLRGQRESGKASVITRLDITNVLVEQDGDRATVSFDYVQGGFDIDLDTGEPLESPIVLPVERVSAVVVRRDESWLMDSYASR